MNTHLSKILPTADPNCKGWESVAQKWNKVGGPRRPQPTEIAKMAPLADIASKGAAGIFGATPEYRAMLSKKDTRVFLFEKSNESYKKMTSILSEDFKVKPTCEELVNSDWEALNSNFGKNSLNLLMGDIIYGYMQTTERLNLFLGNAHSILKKGGKFILRDFANTEFKSTPKEIRHSKLTTDEKRWAYILTKNFAIEGDTFYEEKLAGNLLKISDIKVFKTCATTPRERLMLTHNELEASFSKAGFHISMIQAPQTNGKSYPGIWALEKK